jgi:hypothetical protein
VQFASKFPVRVLICGKIGMTLKTGKRIVDGSIKLYIVDVGFDEFVIFECHHEPVLRMAGQTGFCRVRKVRVCGIGRTGHQQRHGKKKQCNKHYVPFFFHRHPRVQRSGVSKSRLDHRDTGDREKSE